MNDIHHCYGGFGGTAMDLFMINALEAIGITLIIVCPFMDNEIQDRDREDQAGRGSAQGRDQVSIRLLQMIKVMGACTGQGSENKLRAYKNGWNHALIL